MSSSSPRRSDDTKSPLRRSRKDELHQVPNGRHSPRRSELDSPSRQLLHDMHKLQIDQDRKVQQSLDELVAEKKRQHDAQLAQSAAHHERIRLFAEREREIKELDDERLRLQEEAEKARQLERARSARVAQEEADRRRERDRLEREHQERQRRETEERDLRETKANLEALQRREVSDAELRKRKEEEEAKRKAKEASDAAEARSDAQKAVLTTQPAAQPSMLSPDSHRQDETRPIPASTPAATSTVASQTDREQLHQRYLEMHQKLKQMREFVVSESKKIPALKSKIGDWRREITKCMGQLTADKTRNRKPVCRFLPNI